MHFHRHRLWALAAALVLLAQCSGCAQNRKGWHWPWSPEIDDAVGITTPAKRLEEMQKLAANASKQSPAEQERITDDLSKQIQAEQDPLIRRHIIRTLGYYNTPMSTSVLKAAISDSDSQVRIACCEAWGRRGGKEAVDVLSGLLSSDANVDVRLAAARAIGQTRDASAVSPLAEALVDGDPAIQHRVVTALKEVSGKDFGNDVSRWQAFAKGETVEEPPVSIAERIRRLF